MPKIFAILLLVLCFACTNSVHKGDHENYPKLNQLMPDLSPEYLDIPSTDGTVLSALYFKAQISTQNKLLIQFHGNARNISSLFDSQSWLTEHGFDFITFDYRGYGQSSGHASFPEVFDDGAAMIQYAQKRFPQHDIYLWAESLGGMVLTGTLNQLSQTQSLDKIRGVIFEGCFSSLKKTAQFSLAHGIFSFFDFVALFLVSDRYAPIALLKSPLNLSFPILSIHSKMDQSVSFIQGKKLYDILPTKNKCKLWLDDDFHVRVAKIQQGKHQNHILNFLDRGCE